MDDLKNGEVHQISPINNDKVPFRYLLHVTRLDEVVPWDELLYILISNATQSQADINKWGDGIYEIETPLTLAKLKKFSHSVLITGTDTFEDSLETLIEKGCIKKYGSKYRIIKHPWG